MNHPSHNGGGRSGLPRRDFLRIGGLALTAPVGSRLIGLGLDQHGAVEASARRTLAEGRHASSYTFRVQQTEVAPAGKPVTALLVDGRLPGPEIRVKEGDLLRVTVQNAATEPTTLHWHGLLLPAAMDGVPGVSQPPIPPGQVFVYEYPIRQSGTFWYHSHVELQEQRGLSGPFVIEARDEPLRYDHDYVLFLSDWLNSDPTEVIPRLRKTGMSMSGMMTGDMKMMRAEGMKGGMKMGQTADLSDVKYDAFLLNGKSNTDPWTCQTRAGERVRFRLINGGASTFFRFMIDGHALTVTHADGEAVQPVEVDNLLLGSGECYDLVVRVGPSGSYTIRAAAQDGSGAALGLLHTRDAKPTVNHQPPVWGERTLAYAQLRAPHPTGLPAGPERRYALALGGDMARYIWTINDQVYPKADPLVIKEGERVVVEVRNQTRMFHPMHLHGHFYRLLARSGGDDFAPLKHTAWVGPGETLQFEFLADNPGRWFFHCHNLYHLVAGMAREWHYTV